jgi:hypothetical protein
MMPLIEVDGTWNTTLRLSLLGSVQSLYASDRIQADNWIATSCLCCRYPAAGLDWVHYTWFSDGAFASLESAERKSVHRKTMSGQGLTQKATFCLPISRQARLGGLLPV